MSCQMLTGLGFATVLCFRPDLALCFAPIVLPLLFAAPLAVLTSRRTAGDAVARAGFLITPRDNGSAARPVAFRPSAWQSPAPQSSSLG
jgi:membrane glycosyltransferase